MRGRGIPPPYFGEPPTRRPIPVDRVPAVRGKRVILSTPEGFVYDMRAASEPYPDGDGRLVLDITSEKLWYRMQLTGQEPETTRWHTYLVWVE